MAARRPGGGCRRAPQARSQLLDHDLHDGSGGAVLGGPGSQLMSGHDHSAAPTLVTNPPRQDRLKPPKSVSTQGVVAVTASDLLTIC
jgi:hypothetical protein